MSDQQPCDGISSGSIQNTSRQNETSQQHESGKSDKKKQQRQYGTESDAEEQPTKYQPFDLKLLTFKPIGSEQEVDVWHASAEAFHGYIQQFAKGFGKVNVNIWPLAERLAVINVLWSHCQKTGRPFPFAERKQVVPDVDADTIPDVDKPSTEAG